MERLTQWVKEQTATGEVWSEAELSEHDKQITQLFGLARTVQSAGMGIIHTVDYLIVRDWCNKHNEDSIEILMILKAMTSVMNEKR